MGVAVIVIIILLVLAGRDIDRYDRALPEHIAEAVIEELKSGKNIIEYPDMELSVYDASEDDVFDQHAEKISKVKEWSYKVNSGVTSTKEMVYGIFGDGELLAYLKLTNKHSSIALFMLAVNDWEKQSLTPVTKLSTYTLTVDIPKGFSATANGVRISESEAGVKKTYKNGNMIYEISDLFKLPQVEVTDRQGNICQITSKEGYVSVDNLTYYSMVLPKSIKVTDGGVDVAGEPNEADDTKIKYLVGTLNDCIELTDALGQTIKYHKDEELIIRDVNVTIPDNYSISYKDVDLNKYFKGKEANKLYKYVLQLNETLGEGSVTMPENCMYTIPELVTQPEFEIIDNLGQVCEYSYDKYNLVIDKQAGYTEVPDEFKDLDAKTIALMWNDYSQGNLGADKATFNKVAQHLIKDSYLYNAAYISLTNGDIGRISPHGHSTKENYVKSIVVFSDKLVACDVYIRKILTFYGEDGIKPLRTEGKSNDTYYFYKVNGKWKLVDVKVSEDSSYVEL